MSAPGVGAVVALTYLAAIDDPGSLTTLKEKLVKIGAKVVNHGRYVAFQMAEVAIPRNLFADILRMIAELRPMPLPSTAYGVRVS
jgi:hypothetical protein